MDDIVYCPMCRSEVEPRMGFDNEGRRRLLADCPQHGHLDIEVSYYAMATSLIDGEVGR